MTWAHFIWFAVLALAAWSAGSAAAFSGKGTNRMAIVFYVGGIIVYGLFIGALWISLERPPLVTMGETRLWYSFFLSIAGLITYLRWKYKWILSSATLLALVFTLINLLRPEIHNQVLMPALRSIWFIPHVTVYIFSYALFASAFLLALTGLIKPSADVLSAIDNLCKAGLSFFTIGMLLGAIWAKQAWGDFWSWDPKETWAAVTWLLYVLYLHTRKMNVKSKKIFYLLIVTAFISLQIGWYGINYLPWASHSIHNYSPNSSGKELLST